MLDIIISDQIKAAAPGLEEIILEADVTNPPTSDLLWSELEEAAASKMMPIEMVRHRPAIDATRGVYKALGKEPNRYRPSAEALMRRVVSGKGLYRTTAIVDLVNLVSIATGHSIGAFDASHIQGRRLELGVGRAGEPYEAIGRGELNIENLPVFRDEAGGIGTPTSDNVRTALSESTRRLLITLNCYGEGDLPNDQCADLLADLLRRHASATNIEIKKIRP